MSTLRAIGISLTTQPPAILNGALESSAPTSTRPSLITLPASNARTALSWLTRRLLTCTPNGLLETFASLRMLTWRARYFPQHQDSMSSTRHLAAAPPNIARLVMRMTATIQQPILSATIMI